MIRKSLSALLLAAALTGVVQPASAQGFTTGYTDVGPTLALGNIGSASLAFGGRFERGVREIWNGVLGIQAGVTYYSWSVPGASYSYIPIGVTGNYHFPLENKKVDPFLGLGLGYQIINCSVEGLGNLGCSDSAIYFIGRAGVRYFVTEKVALYADAGAGGGTLNIGGMFRLR